MPEELPVTSQFFCVDGTLFMVGGILYNRSMHDLFGILISPEPTNCLWSALPSIGSLTEPWTPCPMLMNSKRADPICVPLRDGRIFICGGTAEHKCWVEFYNPETRKFEGKDLPDCYLYPHPSSCFQWNQQVMIYYDICYDNKEQYNNQYCGLSDKNNTSLLSYDMGTNKWDVIVENLPPQLYDMHERNLVYVGGDILFIIDDAYCWFVYNLSSREKVGEVKVQSEADCPDEGVTGASYVGNNDIESISWVIYLFRAHTDHDPSTLRYVKV